MHKPTVDQDISRILATLNNNGSEEDTGKLESEEPEDIYVYVEPDKDKITFIKRPKPQPEVIEAVQPPQPQSQPQPYFAYIAMTISLLLMFYLVTSAIITVFFPPSVTVTLLTKSKIITATGTIQLPARQIPSITLSQSQTVPTTGKGHQYAKQAYGFITFYNGQFQSVTIAAGTVITGVDGIEIVTNESATIPKASPPIFGQGTVSAHTIMAGVRGNIQAYDINVACCAQSVLAKNINPFTGGQDERSFSIVTQKDINTLASTLKSSLSVSMQGALTAQVKQNETLLTLPCSPQVNTDHQPGDEASTVHVTVLETCQGYTYSKTSFLAQAATILSHRAVKELGSGYTAIGTMQVMQKLTHFTNNTVTITFSSQGLYGYALSKKTQQLIKHLLTGKQKKDAERLLLSMPGIQQVVIPGINGLAKLPKDPNKIHMVVSIPES